MTSEFPIELVESLHSCRNLVALTGAGVSKESGIPTFRDALEGLWAEYDPEDLATPQAFLRNPLLVWDWYAMRRSRVNDVKPNPAHHALAEMSKKVPHFTLITQNVDGLHHAAGSPQVIELHGNIRRVKCFDCGRPAETWQDTPGEVPRCPACRGLLRPDVVWFGEELPMQALTRAGQAADCCQVFLSIGTSGLVHPAASLPIRAVRQGAILVEVNTETTPLTARAHHFLRGRAGEVLPALVNAVWG